MAICKFLSYKILVEAHIKYTHKSSGSETVGRDSLRSCVLSISSRTTQSGRTVTDASLCFNWLGRVKLDCLALCCCCHLRTCLWRSLNVKTWFDFSINLQLQSKVKLEYLEQFSVYHSGFMQYSISRLRLRMRVETNHTPLHIASEYSWNDRNANESGVQWVSLIT